MSALDLTEATQAVWAVLDPDNTLMDDERNEQVAVAIAVTASLVERQVRDRIAAEQLAYVNQWIPGSYRDGLLKIIDIARGEVQP